MRIISRRTLREFWQQPGRRDAEGPLKAWFAEAAAASWQSPADIKRRYQHASFLKNNQVVFNIGGNKYRLVVGVDYDRQVIFIKFIDNHTEYDRLRL
ncbi:MAG: type II toxin-antitoxin system HigB family toxin [Pseudohongiellaceae bacterium]